MKPPTCLLLPDLVPISQEIYYCHKLGTVHLEHGQRHHSSQHAFSFQTTHVEQPTIPYNDYPLGPRASHFPARLFVWVDQVPGCRSWLLFAFSFGIVTFPEAQAH